MGGGGAPPAAAAYGAPAPMAPMAPYNAPGPGMGPGMGRGFVPPSGGRGFTPGAGQPMAPGYQQQRQGQDRGSSGGGSHAPYRRG